MIQQSRPSYLADISSKIFYNVKGHRGKWWGLAGISIIKIKPMICANMDWLYLDSSHSDSLPTHVAQRCLDIFCMRLQCDDNTPCYTMLTGMVFINQMWRRLLIARVLALQAQTNVHTFGADIASKFLMLEVCSDSLLMLLVVSIPLYHCSASRELKQLHANTSPFSTIIWLATMWVISSCDVFFLCYWILPFGTTLSHLI